jgi:hypothetical protein
MMRVTIGSQKLKKACAIGYPFWLLHENANSSTGTRKMEMRTTLLEEGAPFPCDGFCS